MKRLLFGLLFLLVIPAFTRCATIETKMVEAPTVLSAPFTAAAQSGTACGTGVAHCTTLGWTASTTTGVTYNVCRSTTSGAENCAVPLNASPITSTSYIDPITLTNSQQTFFYVIVAVETITGFGTVDSVPSNEASATFPAIPAPATGNTATPH